MFERITVEDGLSQNVVVGIHQDPEGRVWLGTQEGLNVHDGEGIVQILRNAAGEYVLSNNWIWGFSEDRDGNVWIATDGGLNKFDRKSGAYRKIEIPGPPLSIKVVYHDTSGRLWFGSELGLSTQSEDGSFEHFTHDSNDPRSIGPGAVRSIFQDLEGFVWVGTEASGISKFDPARRVFEHFDHDRSDPHSMAGKHVRTILEVDGRYMWIGTYDHGLSVLDKKTQTFEWFKHDREDSHSLSSNRVRKIIADRRGRIWVATARGVNLFNRERNWFTRYKHDPGDRQSISSDEVFHLHQDQGGVIWAATFNGVSRWNGDLTYFGHARHEPARPGSLANNVVYCFAEDHDGRVYVGTQTGLDRWHRRTGTFERVPVDEWRDKNIMSLLVDTQGQLWVGTMSHGLYRRTVDGNLTHFRHDPSDPSSLSADAVTRIFEDAAGNIWATTWGGGINRYAGQGWFEHYPDRYQGLLAIDVVEPVPGELWFAVDGPGVLILEGPTRAARWLGESPEGRQVGRKVINLHATADSIWIGTRDEGLFRLDRESRSISRVDAGHGLRSNAVYGLLQDRLGRIWISSGKGLAVYAPESAEVRYFDPGRGLQSNDFNTGAYAELADGTFLFGGSNGFNHFDPDEMHFNAYAPPVRLTRFTKYNEPYDLGRPLHEVREINIGYDDRVIGFEFAALDYTAPHQNRYRYRLDGFDRDWVDAGTTPRATYTNLDPGGYRFRAIGSNNDGVWNDEGLAIDLVVAAPWWATAWAYALYLVAACGAAYAGHRARLVRLARQQEEAYHESLRLYVASLEEANDSVVIADAHMSVIYANRAAAEMLGRAPSHDGRDSMLALLFDEESERSSVAGELAASGRWQGEVERRSEGEALTTDISIAGVTDADDSRVAFVSIARDVTQRKRVERELADYRQDLERLVGERTQALRREMEEHRDARHELADSLKEKESLLKEVHHRVKNNMQVISSLLSIQAEGAGDTQLAALVRESQQRIRSMALIHEHLYQTERLADIDFGPYVHMLVTSLGGLYGDPGGGIRYDIDVADVHLDIDMAIPCGLIINELVSNALKHGFDDRRPGGVVGVRFRRAGSRYHLEVANDGVGLPDGFTLEQVGTLGLEIVTILVQQLRGEVSFERQPVTTFIIRFPS